MPEMGAVLKLEHVRLCNFSLSGTKKYLRNTYGLCYEAIKHALSITCLNSNDTNCMQTNYLVQWYAVWGAIRFFTEFFHTHNWVREHI